MYMYKLPDDKAGPVSQNAVVHTNKDIQAVLAPFDHLLLYRIAIS
jgi:hypothetical protein